MKQEARTMRLKRRSSSRRASSSSSSSSSSMGAGKAGVEGWGRGGGRNSPPAASTPLRAGSASSMKNKMRAPLPPATWGFERREKGRFHLRLIQHAARSAN